jgi:3-oxosteroid 1-dehydrogenase
MFAGAPHTVMVNRTGRRFADESFFHDLDASFARFDGSTGQFPNRPAWFVFDANFRSKYPLGPIMPGQPLPDGLVETADSIGELADILGMDRTNLEDTVERFNKACAAGVDEEFGRGLVPWSQVSFGDARVTPNPLLGPVDKPPFHALQLTRLAASLPSAGLKTDTVGRVLRADGAPIPGLYAAGNSAARIDTGGYQSGTANARGLTFGYLAARDTLTT